MKVEGMAMSLPLVTPEALSRSARKRWFFGHDTYFREGWHWWIDQAGESIAISTAQQHTLLLLKPDAMAARAVARTVSQLAAAGFRSIWAQTVRLDRWGTRELWRYDLNIATLQRLSAIDLLLPACESIVLVLRDLRWAGHESAAERLSQLKGPSLVCQRRPWHLRSAIGARDGLLNFIHSPDESADVVRELAVLLDREAFHSALGEVLAARCEAFNTAALAARCYTEAPEHDLDVSESTKRILSALERRCPRTGNLRVTKIFDRMVPDLRVDWEATLAQLVFAELEAHRAHARSQVVPELFRLARSRGAAPLWPDADVRFWDAVVFAAGHTVSNLEGVRPTLEMTCMPP